MTDYTLSTSASVLDIRTSYALAKIYQRFGLGNHATMMRDALLAAEHHAFNVSMNEQDLANCPLLFADEPDLAQAWKVGVEEQRKFGVELDQDMRAEEAREAEMKAEADYYDQVESEFWDDVYDDCRSQGLVA